MNQIDRLWLNRSALGLAPNVIYAVGGSGADDVWAGGAGGSVFRCGDKTECRPEQISLVGDQDYAHYSGINGLVVFSPTDAWFGLSRGRIFHHRAGRWARVAPGGAGDYALTSVARGRSALFAGGGGLLLQREGSVWSTVKDMPAIRGVGGDGQDVWAVGEVGAIRSLAAAGWSSEESPVTEHLNAVWAQGNSVFAVGESGTILQRRGGAWMKEVSGVTSHLLTVTGDAAQVFAGGEGGILLRRSLPVGSWQKEMLPVAGPVRSVLFSGGQIYALAGDGRRSDLLLREPMGWRRAGDGHGIVDLALVGDEIWGVGGGAARLLNGALSPLEPHYTVRIVPRADFLTRLFPLGPGEFLAVGGSSAVIRYQ